MSRAKWRPLVPELISCQFATKAKSGSSAIEMPIDFTQAVLQQEMETVLETIRHLSVKRQRRRAQRKQKTIQQMKSASATRIAVIRVAVNPRHHATRPNNALSHEVGSCQFQSVTQFRKRIQSMGCNIVHYRISSATQQALG